MNKSALAARQISREIPMKKHPQRGFTLIEIMTVVAILAVLGAVAFAAYDYYTNKSRAADIVSSYEAVRTQVAAARTEGAGLSCDELKQRIGSKNLSQNHATLDIGFEPVGSSGGQRPVLTVRADAGGGNVSAARSALGTLEKTGGIEAAKVDTPSQVVFAVALSARDQALCSKGTQVAAQPSPPAGQAQPQASQLPQAVLNARAKLSKEDLAKKKAALQARVNKREVVDKKTAHKAEQARQEAAARAQAEAQRRRQQSLLAHAQEQAKKGRHKEAEAARAAAAKAEQDRLAAEAAAKAAAQAALAQPCPGDQIRDGVTHQCRDLVCTEEVIPPVVHPYTSSLLPQYSDDIRALQNEPIPKAPALPPNPIDVKVDGVTVKGAPGAECLICGDLTIDEGCSDLDLYLRITYPCQDDKPVCLNTVKVNSQVDGGDMYARCVSIDEAKQSAQASNGCIDGAFNVQLIPGAVCNRSCYGGPGQVCNIFVPGTSTVGTTKTVCR
jgi:prepilin-type N-terminal cleavage/methylation domain-containing protein